MSALYGSGAYGGSLAFPFLDNVSIKNDKRRDRFITHARARLPSVASMYSECTFVLCVWDGCISNIVGGGGIMALLPARPVSDDRRRVRLYDFTNNPLLRRRKPSKQCAIYQLCDLMALNNTTYVCAILMQISYEWMVCIHIIAGANSAHAT